MILIYYLIINYSNIEHYLFDNSQTFRLLELSKPLGETIDFFELGNFIKEHTNLKLRDSFIEANVLNLRKEKYTKFKNLTTMNFYRLNINFRKTKTRFKNI